MKPWVASSVLIILVLCSIAPFASRAVYMDEHQYLNVAKFAAEKNWRFPQDTPWVFFGKPYANMATQTHPPVGEYYLAFLFKLFGHFDEVKFRLLFSVFPILAVLGFYRLAKRFTDNPLLVTSLFAVSPAFFVMSPSLMMDMPMLAFLLMGLSYYFDYPDGNPASLWLAALFFTLSAGNAYSVLIPVGCLFIWAVINRRSKSEWFALFAAPAAVLIWLLILRIHFGENVAIKWSDYLLAHFSLRQKLLPMFSFLGGIGILPWAFLAVAEMPRKKTVALLSILAAIALSFLHAWTSLSYRLWFLFLMSSGIAWLLLFGMKSKELLTGKQSQARRFLIVWMPAMLLFLLLFPDMVSSRYFLLALPPLFLVTFQRIRRKAALISFFVTTILSFSLAISDYRFVNSYRNWVSQTVPPVQGQGYRFWSAAESGLRYYLEQNDSPTLSFSDLRPRGGDLIVRQASFAYALSNELEPLLMCIRRIEVMDAYPIRTFSKEAGAGFHDSHFGIVPYCFSRAALDSIEIEEVSPFVKDLPQVVPADFSSVPVWFPGGVLLKQVQPKMEFSIRLASGSKLEYELEGKASVKISSEGITLENLSPVPAIWKNFRMVPNSWPVSGEGSDDGLIVPPTSFIQREPTPKGQSLSKRN